jgi:F-type H+-transporting ATPase subunit alpha
MTVEGSSRSKNKVNSSSNKKIKKSKKVISDRFGFVKTVGDGVVKAIGLKKVAYGEVVFFPGLNIKGLTFNLNKNDVDILVFGNERLIKAGATVIGTKKGLFIPVSKDLLGRIVNPLGEVVDGGEKIKATTFANVNNKAPGIIYRQRINEPLFTGIKVIDSLIPIGKGQRELIIGDKGTGKSSICFDIILNQKYENEKNYKDRVLCVYVSIGQKRSSVKTIHDNLKKFGADSYTVIVAASSSDNASLQYLAPYSGCAIAEYFMGFAHSLIVYDDLSQHAMAYRQISLLLRRPPGREAYPGDIFYLHSRLLERSLKLHINYGGGSMTALPVVETLFGDVTAYIPTNVISITDGQIFLDKNLFIEGVLPAINIGLSVSRVGSAAQILAMRKISGSLKLELAQYREIKDFVKFGSDLDEATVNLIKKGKLLMLLLNQGRFSPVPIEEQVLILFAGLNGFLNGVSNVNKYFTHLFSFIKKNLLFRSHLEMLRFDEYYKIFGNEGLEILLTFFKEYEFSDKT